MGRTRYRSVWISDTHLGSFSVQADELAFFLKHVACDHLYLVGDIVDMWRLTQRWKWPASHNVVVRRILKHAARGTRVLYIPGNHDDAARAYAGLELGGIGIALNAAHRTADGRDLLVTHGDQYDLVVRHHRLLSKAGAIAYDALLGTNRVWNAGRRLVGLPHHSLSKAIKERVKSACTFVSDFEGEVVAEARRGGFDGVVCGHIHKADARASLGTSGVAYYNCGDWVESCTALVEHDDGRMEVIDGRAFNASTRTLLGAMAPASDPHDEWPEVPMPFPLPATRRCEPAEAGR
ncbi:MAG: UDP-2,3-diacylglucosamine diphosphatase [Phycisphaerae bacterium]|nr:UDP-2,3-diacylglucosamine diphosphatase [Phycisphaerae bacterium]